MAEWICKEMQMIRQGDGATIGVRLERTKELVRCKDCEHATMTADGKMCKYCAMDTDDFGDQRDVYHDADWFCADGERNTE